MVKIKVTNNQPEQDKPLQVKVNNLPDELLKKSEDVDDNLRLKITSQGKEKKLVIQFRKKNGQLQAKQANGKNWVKVVENKATKLDGNVKIKGLDEYIKQQEAVAKQGTEGGPGEDGQSVELRKTNKWIEWKQEDERGWKKLVSLNELQGPPGKDGTTTIIGGGGGGGDSSAVQSVVAGDNVMVDNTDPKNPIINVTIPPDAGVMTVVGGDHVIVDSSNPASPVVSANLAVDDLTDVDIDGLNPNQYLFYTGTGWINSYSDWANIVGVPTFSDVATSGLYSDLTDVNVTGLGDDYIMAWDADLNQWTPRANAPSAGSVAWGAITGAITAQTDLIASFVRTTGSANQTITGSKNFTSAILANAGIVSGANISITGSGQLVFDNNPSGNFYVTSWDNNFAFGGQSGDTAQGNNYTGIMWAKGLGGWQHPYTTFTGMHFGYFNSGPGIFFAHSVATNYRRYGVYGNEDGSAISGLSFGSSTNNGNSITEQLRLTMDAVGAANSVLDFKSITKIINLVEPTNPQDGATKNYVDDAIVGASGGIDGVDAGVNIDIDTTDPSNPIVNTILTPTFDTVAVDDDVYDAGWETDLTVPTKNALWVVLGDIEAALAEILGA